MTRQPNASRLFSPDAPGNPGRGQLVYLGSFGPQVTNLGGIYSQMNGVRESFAYLSGSTSTLGTGVSGANGIWSDSGTQTESSSATQDFPPLDGWQGFIEQSRFVYDDYNVWCSSTDETLPVSFAAGTYGYSNNVPVATFCSYEKNGSKFTMNTSGAFTYQAGVNITADIGIYLQATTGYNDKTSITDVYTENGYICGTHDYPGGQPRVLTATTNANGTN